MNSGQEQNSKETRNRLSLLSGWMSRVKDPYLFRPDDLDIYTNRVTGEAWIFHAPPISIEISEVEYHHKTKRMVFVSKEGKRYDLGVKIQPLIRATIEKISSIVVTQVTDGMPVSWFSCPVKHISAGKDQAD